MVIMNNRLRWDGSFLGEFPVDIKFCEWEVEGSKYLSLRLLKGVVHCMATRTNDLFPCIVEDIKPLFGIPRRGVHRIKLGNYYWLLYYVPISSDGSVIWETPLSRLDAKHPLRKDAHLRQQIRRTIVFCDILALNSTSETTIRLRHGSNGSYEPICINERTTAISKQTVYDFSILSKVLFDKWFGEEILLSDVLYDMFPGHNLAQLSSEMRSSIEAVVRKYDTSYLWYVTFIVDRMSRHLLYKG